MVSRVICVVLLAALAAVATDAAKLPSIFGRCSKSDPKIKECLKTNIEDAVRKLKDGSKELGLMALEPLKIPALKIGQGKGAVGVEQNYKDVEYHGLSASKVLSANIDFHENVLRATFFTPELRLQAHYTIKGRILVLPVEGDGPCNITLSNLKMDHIVTAETKDKEGKSYWSIKDYQITFTPEKVTTKLDNLFGGDKRLGDEINKVMNENWREIFKDVKEGYEKSLALIFKGMANRVFSRVPLPDIFLE